MKGTMMRIKFEAKRWPWQKGYNWHGMEEGAMLNPVLRKTNAAPRFGAGWVYGFGIRVGSRHEHGRTILLELIYGFVTIRFLTAKGVAYEKERKK